MRRGRQLKLERLSSSKFKSGDLKRVVTARKVTGKKENSGGRHGQKRGG